MSKQEEYKKMGLGNEDNWFYDILGGLHGDLSKETQTINKYKQAQEELNKAIGEGNTKAVEKAQKKLNELRAELVEQAQITQEVCGATGEYTEAGKNLMEFVDGLISAEQEKLKSTDALTYITDKYSSTLKLEGDTYKFVTQAAKDAAIEQEKIERAKTKNLYNETMTRIGILKAGAKANIPQGTMTNTEYARHINAYSSEEIAAETKLLAEYQAQIKAADNAIKELEQMRVIDTSLSSLSSDSGSKSSSASPIETKDDFQAVIDGIQLKAEKQKELNDLYQQNIDLMEVMYYEQGRLAYEEDLLEGQKNLVNQLKDENEKLMSLKEDLVKTYGYSIEQVNQWFDENGNLTLKYYEDLNSYVGKTDDASKEAQAALEDLADKVGTIHDEIKDNLTNIQELEIEWMEKASSLAREYVELEKENKLNKLDDEYQKRLEDLSKEVYGTENADDYNSFIEEQIELLQNKIDTLKEIEDQENKELEKQEKLLAIEEARIKLANAQKNKTVAVLRKQADGTYQNEYIADQDAIDEARDELTQAELDYNEYINQLKIETLEEQIEALRREQEEKKNNYDKQLDDLEKWYNDQEDYYEEYYDDLDKLTYEFLQKMRKAYNDDFGKIIEETQKLINSIDVPHGSVTTEIGGSFIQGSSSNGNSSSNSSSISGSSNGIYAGMTDAQKANEIKYLNSIINNPNSSAGNKIWAENQLKDLYGYAEGGVATYTGLAKLHGTPNNPEVIFNAKDAQKLYDLIHFNLIPIPRFNNNWQLSETNKDTGISSITIEKVEFPNATNSNEIKDALLSLPRVVLQY